MVIQSNFYPVSVNYIVSVDLDENKIFIKRKNDGIVTRKLQIFAPNKEFPFLYYGTFNFSDEYETWISIAKRDDFLDWTRGGCVLRFLNDDGIIEEEVFLDLASCKTKVLFVTPHLSTGGCPQYLLKKIETYKNSLDIYVIEYSYSGPAFVVQRDKIIDLLKDGRFFSLGGKDKIELLTLINEISPDIIHFEEIPESFIEYRLIDEIYTKPERKYFITETTHSSHSKPSDKRFFPDKFIFCSRYSQEQFKILDIPSEVWEYPIEIQERPNRILALERLGLDPTYTHILNVGLFTPGKNQGELFEIARKFLGEKIQFHFVGNQAQNFEHYWAPIMKKIPSNCKIWGERSDVENFLSSCDIFYFSSIFELNPLVVKEALSWKMPVLMHDLETYMSAYANNANITFLTTSISKNVKLLRNVIEKTNKNTYRAKIVHIVSEIRSSEMERNSIFSVSQLASPEIEYTIHYNVPTTEMPTKLPLQQNDNLRPGHFGCYEAFRKAISEDFTDEYDYLIVCERDCILEKSIDETHNLLTKTFQLMKDENIEYFSFGDSVDLDHGYPQSPKLRDLPGGFAYLTDKIIGLQFIIFSKNGRNFLRGEFNRRGWYGMDIWLNIIFEEANKKMGILNERATTQLEGFSLIDNREKIFKANHK